MPIQDIWQIQTLFYNFSSCKKLSSQINEEMLAIFFIVVTQQDDVIQENVSSLKN